MGSAISISTRCGTGPLERPRRPKRHLRWSPVEYRAPGDRDRPEHAPALGDDSGAYPDAEPSLRSQPMVKHQTRPRGARCQPRGGADRSQSRGNRGCDLVMRNHRTNQVSGLARHTIIALIVAGVMLSACSLTRSSELRLADEIGPATAPGKQATASTKQPSTSAPSPTPRATAKTATSTPTGKQQATPSPARRLSSDAETSADALNTTLEALRSTGRRVTQTADRPDLRLRSTAEPGALLMHERILVPVDRFSTMLEGISLAELRACMDGKRQLTRLHYDLSEPGHTGRSHGDPGRTRLSRQTAAGRSGERGRLGRSDVDRHHAVRSPECPLARPAARWAVRCGQPAGSSAVAAGRAGLARRADTGGEGCPGAPVKP